MPRSPPGLTVLYEQYSYGNDAACCRRSSGVEIGPVPIALTLGSAHSVATYSTESLAEGLPPQGRNFMHAIIRPALAATAAFLLVPSTATAQPASAPSMLNGTWKLDPAASKFTSGPAIKSETRT
jgi:hypothetical protein